MLAHVVFELTHAMAEPVQLGEGELGLVHHRVGRVEVRVLHQVADLHATVDGDDAGLGHDLAHDDFEQRRFARAIGADKARRARRGRS